MRTTPKLKRMRGAAVVEFALVFVGTWTVVVLCWVAGNIALQRSLIKAAARDAAMLVANANPAEMATSAAVNQLEDRAEALLQEAVERGGSEVSYVNIARRVTGSYGPALNTVRVTVDATVVENVFPNSFMFGQYPVTITVEVPYGGRLSGP
jgi:hypothetical protein